MKRVGIKSLLSSKYTGYNTDIQYADIENIDYCIYFITDGEYTKIGVAASLPNRVKQLQTGNARRLVVKYIMSAENQRDAMDIEKKLHKHYRDYCTCGEWFNLTEKQIMESQNVVNRKLKYPCSRFDFEIDGIYQE